MRPVRSFTFATMVALAAAPLALGSGMSATGVESPDGSAPDLIVGPASASAKRAEGARGISDPFAKTRHVVRVDSAALEKSSILLELGGSRFGLERTRAAKNPSGSSVWAGQSADGGQATMVRDGAKVTASITRDNRLFRIAPGAAGTHVVTEVDLAAMPDEHPQQVALPDGGGKSIAHQAMASKPATDRAANTVVRVLVAASKEAETANGGSLRSLAELAVAETNTGYANSGIPITMELADYRSTTYSESTSFSTNLTRFSSTSDGYLDDLHGVRNTVKADVNVLLVNTSSACGFAYVGATAASAFSVVAASCATGYYSFGHEIGHNQGAEHDPANSSSSGYNHGYQYPAGKWRTVMAYNCSTGCTRINYWSNPRKTYGGVAMGTTAKSDNARTLSETAVKVGSFR